MRRKEFSIPFDICAGGTEVTGRSFVLAVASQELYFDRYREVLVDAHALRCLAMEHDPAVSPGPAGSFFCLFAHETVFQPDPVVSEGPVIKKVSESFVEFVVSVVANHDLTIFDPEGVGEIHACRMMPDLRSPSGEVLSVEEGYPVLAGARLCMAAGWWDQEAE